MGRRAAPAGGAMLDECDAPIGDVVVTSVIKDMPDENTTLLDELRYGLERACTPTYTPYIIEGRKKLCALPRSWVHGQIAQTAKMCININDDWEYRRLLEALSILAATNAMRQFVSIGLDSQDSDVRAAANDWVEIGLAWPGADGVVDEWLPVRAENQFTDITDRFEILEDHLMYVDAPLEGLLRARDSGSLFAFSSTQLDRAPIWHWIVLPTHASELAVGTQIEAALTGSTSTWISIVEDRRNKPCRMYIGGVDMGSIESLYSA